MAGKTNHAQKLSAHLGTPIDAACVINKPGATATVVVAGVVGMAASATATRRGADGEIKVITNGWLAVGPRSFALVKGDKFLGNPKGEPFAEIDYTDVASVSLKPGRLTVRADVALTDGRSFAFETNTRGANKRNPEVLELFAERCR
ncbi:MAG TPA: hypothetical protein VMU39_01130 [Solirubrobacteraceae bacterium]|nr:hypothetical protein [Solirubrobacteraceae bacterium]